MSNSFVFLHQRLAHIAGLFAMLLCLISCSSIQSVGSLGPKKLNVYAISQTDFLSASRMLVILDKKGDVAAYSGGTVVGSGAVALQTTTSLINSGAIVYGANAFRHGLEHANMNVKGIPNNVNINTNSNINFKGGLNK